MDKEKWFMLGPVHTEHGETPVPFVPVLVKVRKRKKAPLSRGQRGEFYTQAYYDNTPYYRKDGTVYHQENAWYDYTGRLIQKLDSKNPSTIVLEWAYIFDFGQDDANESDNSGK